VLHKKASGESLTRVFEGRAQNNRPKNIFAKTLDKGVLADYLRALF
jgi:hypothetical protein